MTRKHRGAAAKPVAVPERAAGMCLLVVAGILFVALRWPCAATPLERDEGAYAYVAQRALAGAVPYRDVFDHKPPGVYLAYLPPVALFGTSVVAIHVNLYAWTALTGLFLFLVARELAGSLAASAAALVFGFLTIEPSWLATAANTEQFLLLPMVASVWCLLRGERTAGFGWWAASGALAAAACWIKPVAVTHAFFLAIFAWARWRKRAPRTSAWWLVSRGAWTAAGGAAVSIAVVAFFAWRGAWKDFVDAVLAHNAGYIGEVPFSAGLAALKARLASQSGALWPIWIAASAALLDLRRDRRSAGLLVGGAMVAAAAGIAVGWHFREHYFLQAAPALAAAAGLAVARAVRAGSRAFRLAPAAVACLAAAAIVGPGLVNDSRFFFATTPAEKVVMLYWPNPFDVADEIAARVRTRTSPSDSVLIYGSEPEILFLAQRRSATRYVVFYPLTSAGVTAERRQREAWEEIQAASPRAVLMTELPFSLLPNPASPQFLRNNVERMLGTGWELDALEAFTGPAGSRGRMVFGQDARDLVARARQYGNSAPLDMFLFLRR